MGIAQELFALLDIVDSWNDIVCNSTATENYSIQTNWLIFF